MKDDFFYLDKSSYGDCDICKHKNDYFEFEETPNDGGAPCKRCKFWDGEE